MKKKMLFRFSVVLFVSFFFLPSLTRALVEEETLSSVEGAWTMVIGPSVFMLKRSHVGGWFNITEDSQPMGTYLVMAFKLGYRPVLEVVNYQGAPVQQTLEMKRWL